MFFECESQCESDLVLSDLLSLATADNVIKCTNAIQIT